MKPRNEASMIQVDLDPNELDALLHTARGWAARDNDVADTQP